jgi:hypothetical protein
MVIGTSRGFVCGSCWHFGGAVHIVYRERRAKGRKTFPFVFSQAVSLAIGEKNE